MSAPSNLPCLSLTDLARSDPYLKQEERSDEDLIEVSSRPVPGRENERQETQRRQQARPTRRPPPERRAPERRNASRRNPRRQPSPHQSPESDDEDAEELRQPRPAPLRAAVGGRERGQGPQALPQGQRGDGVGARDGVLLQRLLRRMLVCVVRGR